MQIADTLIFLALAFLVGVLIFRFMPSFIRLVRGTPTRLIALLAVMLVALLILLSRIGAS